MSILLLNENEIRELITLAEAIPAMEKAFSAFSRKKAAVPPVISLEVPEHEGEVHIKTAHIHDSSNFVVKIASGFWENRLHDLPIGSGMMLVFSAISGFPEAILLDNGYLTELRTAAAGAVAARHMAPTKVLRVGIIGAGMQGRYQLEALLAVRSFERAFIYDHHSQNSRRFVSDLQQKYSAELVVAERPMDACRETQVIITATPSREPIVQADWVSPGTHITAMGSDGPDKQELEVGVLRKADRIVADSIPQCLQLGEIHHAIAAGAIRMEEITGELGQVINGDVPGRASEHEITVCDLTGVGVQDAAIAGLVYKKALERNMGARL